MSSAKVKLFAPTDFVANLRKHHVGQMQLAGMRKFMSRQCFGNETPLSCKKDEKTWTRLWLPCSTGFTEQVELPSNFGIDAEYAQKMQEAERMQESGRGGEGRVVTRAPHGRVRRYHTSHHYAEPLAARARAQPA